MEPFGKAQQPHPSVWRAKGHQQPSDFMPPKLAPQSVEIPQRRAKHLPALFTPPGKREPACALRGHKTSFALGSRLTPVGPSKMPAKQRNNENDGNRNTYQPKKS
jgi:hypothetical protein